MTHVVVAVPAHDEADEIGDCLDAVVAASRFAVRSRRCASVTVGVALHRCTDHTGYVAERVLSAVPGAVIRTDLRSRGVGEVRAGLVSELVLGSVSDDVWVFNTDADSRVPRDWISHTLDLARRSDAVAVAGMVALRGWSAPSEVMAQYEVILEAGVTGEAHQHVYGANLAVRLDAYRRVGGFGPCNGEDQDLVDRLRRDGQPVLASFAPLVVTSAREPGRAAGGLGALLQRLRREAGSIPVTGVVGVEA